MATVARRKTAALKGAGRDDLVDPPEVGPAARLVLLELARTALAKATGSRGTGAGAQPQAQPTGTGNGGSALACLDEPRAVFVTLTIDGHLRGCIGGLFPERPLRVAVARAAVSAALGDPRFRPVTADELPRIHLGVSILGPLTPLDDPHRFQPGVDGIVVDRLGRVGLLLPEVADEFGLDGRGMLDAVCQKAGLPRDAWLDRSTRLLTFRTTRFDGPAVNVTG
jgi:AmmeMemoRadiSam system protein A